MLRKSKHIEGAYSLVGKFFYCVAVLGIFYFLYRMVDSLAGLSTDADLQLSFLIDVSVYLAWIAGASGVAYGAKQRKLRRDTVERLQIRITELEKEIDPGRTSSGLTGRGDTNPEDKI